MKSVMAVTAIMLLLLAGATQLPPDRVSEISLSLREACTFSTGSTRASNERAAATALKILCSAQADFRANDRDGDGVNQFWRADVAGLYAITPRGGVPLGLIPLGLIPLEIAAADARPRVNLAPYAGLRPSSGYRFRAIRHADENPNALDPNRFAFVAYPVRPSAGKYAFIIDENNSIFRTRVEDFEEFDVFPSDEELKARWGRA